MPKYHITKTGDPGVCRATVQACPLGAADEHYDDPQEARSAYEEAAGHAMVAPVGRRLVIYTAEATPAPRDSDSDVPLDQEPAKPVKPRAPRSRSQKPAPRPTRPKPADYPAYRVESYPNFPHPEGLKLVLERAPYSWNAVPSDLSQEDHRKYLTALTAMSGEQLDAIQASPVLFKGARRTAVTNMLAKNDLSEEEALAFLKIDELSRLRNRSAIAEVHPTRRLAFIYETKDSGRTLDEMRYFYMEHTREAYEEADRKRTGLNGRFEKLRNYLRRLGQKVIA